MVVLQGGGEAQVLHKTLRVQREGWGSRKIFREEINGATKMSAQRTEKNK